MLILRGRVDRYRCMLPADHRASEWETPICSRVAFCKDMAEAIEDNRPILSLRVYPVVQLGPVAALSDLGRVFCLAISSLAPGLEWALDEGKVDHNEEASYVGVGDDRRVRV